MINNDILRSVRYMLDLSDGKVVEIAKLADTDLEISKEDIPGWLKRDEEEGFVECSNLVLAHFLDGLIIYKRGVDPNLPRRAVDRRINNNVVLKKLRVAFELKDIDMHQCFEDAGFPVSKPELSAFFRQRDHRNYRQCGDQILRNFLKGLTLRVRG
jgi:uncharacterized protein YehS (DUF1456 family)